MQADASPRPNITSAAEARTLVNSVLDMLAALSHVVGEETALVKDGKLSAALGREARKSELAGSYFKSLQLIKANAVALARFSPADVERLKEAHGQFLSLIQTNQMVLATARAVSETIVRDLAREANPPAQVAGYGPASAARAPQIAAGPILVSKSL